MKLVIDTNVFLSGTFWTGKPAQLLDAVESGRATFICSTPLLAEFANVLCRKQFAEHLARHQTTARILINQFASVATMVDPAVLPMPPELRDPNDLMVLTTAVGGGADAIASGDKDLLVMGEFQGIPILDVAGILARLS